MFLPLRLSGRVRHIGDIADVVLVRDRGSRPERAELALSFGKALGQSRNIGPTRKSADDLQYVSAVATIERDVQLR